MPAIAFHLAQWRFIQLGRKWTSGNEIQRYRKSPAPRVQIILLRIGFPCLPAVNVKATVKKKPPMTGR
jgi:hypothetical protein